MTYIVHYRNSGGKADSVRGVDRGVPGTGANTPLVDCIGNIADRGGTVTRAECVSVVGAMVPVPVLVG